MKKKKRHEARSFKVVTVEANGKKRLGYRAVSTVCHIDGRETVIAAATLGKLKKNWNEISLTPFNPARAQHVIIIRDLWIK